MFRALRRLSCLVVSALVMGTAAPASASVFGEENLTLAAILAEAVKTVDSLNEQLSAVRKTYDATKRLVGLADDAYSAYQAAAHFNLSIGSVNDLFDQAFPDLGHMRRDFGSEGSWRGSGELRYLVKYCVGEVLDDRRCLELENALTAREARDTLAATFGEIPSVGLPEEISLRRTRAEAALALADADAQEKRSRTVIELQARQLAEKCQRSGNPAECDAAANQAQMLQLEELARLNAQLAEQNRLSALRMEQANAERLRELEAIARQRQLTIDAARESSRTPIRVESEGFDLLGGN